MAHQNTEDIVRKENALMNFELLLSVDLFQGERERLTKESRELRTETWKELEKESERNYG